jgi:hypothetical protein
LVGRLQWKRPLVGPRHRFEDNVEMNIREIIFENVNWIQLAHLGSSGRVM